MTTKPGMFPSVRSAMISITGWIIASVVATWLIYKGMTWLIHIIYVRVNSL